VNQVWESARGLGLGISGQSIDSKPAQIRVSEASLRLRVSIDEARVDATEGSYATNP